MDKTQEIPIVFNSSGLSLRGILHQPFGKGVYPAFVFCHGYFQSNRIGPFALYVELARLLAANGIACLRFDCAGFGESEGKYMDASYKSLSSNLSDALHFMRSQRKVDQERLGIIGHSLGGNIALQVARKDQSIRGLCLLSPIPTTPLSKASIFSKRQLDELKGSGITTRKGIPATRVVYDKINSGIAFRLAKNVTCSTLIVYGGRDPYYKKDQYVALSRAFGRWVTLHEIPVADHNFFPLQSRLQLEDRVLTWSKQLLGLPQLVIRKGIK